MLVNQRRKLLDQFSALCDGSLSPEESRQLAETLKTSEEARVAYVQFLDIHASLDRDSATQVTGLESLPELDHLISEGCFEDHPASPSTAEAANSQAIPVAQNQLSTPEAKPGYLRVQEFLAAAAAMLLLGFVFWKTLPRPGTEYVASIISNVDCEWEGLSTSSDDPLKLRAGQKLTLNTGVAKLRFDDETVVLIESPTCFEAISASSMRVFEGTVALRAEGDKKDFTVLAPNASIVDRGTSFGVHCGRDGVDVEVFEGKVEITPSNDVKRAQVLSLGASARIRNENGRADIDMFAADEGRFTDLLQMLWEDIHDRGSALAGDPADGVAATAFPHQEFDLPADPLGIDTFHGSKTGGGWITPWVASGHPIGELTDVDPLVAAGNPYLRLHFNYSYSRAIAREYGGTSSFDPEKPHVISWIWRFDGQDEDFGDYFRDRVAIYGNDYFRTNSASDVTWFIGWAGDHERNGARRKTIPKRWFVFDGTNGSEYGPENMVDTGMELKRGVVYRMAVVLYPESKQYEAVIQDDEQTFFSGQLGYRNPNSHGGHVIHCGVGTTNLEGDAGFSIDSISVQPLSPDLVPSDLPFDVPVDRPADGSSI